MWDIETFVVLRRRRAGVEFEEIQFQEVCRQMSRAPRLCFDKPRLTAIDKDPSRGTRGTWETRT